MILRNKLRISSIVGFVLLTIFISFMSSVHSMAAETGIIIDVNETGNGNQAPIFTPSDGLLIPGGSVSSTFSVRNNCSFSIVMDSFQLGNFEIRNNSDIVLPSESQQYIDFTKNVSYRIMRGDSLIINSNVNNWIDKTVSVKSDIECTLRPGEIKVIKIVADMKSEAGNSVQGLKNFFVIAMNFRAVTSSGGGGGGSTQPPGSGTSTVLNPDIPTVPVPSTPTILDPNIPTVPVPDTSTISDPFIPLIPIIPVPPPANPPVIVPTGTIDPISKLDGSKVTARLIQTGSPVDMTALITIGVCFMGVGSVLLCKKKKGKQNI